MEVERRPLSRRDRADRDNGEVVLPIHRLSLFLARGQHPVSVCSHKAAPALRTPGEPIIG